jgi:hypothetical protein
MEIQSIWMSQRTLRRRAQIAGMVEALQRGELLPPIVLAHCEDDSIQVDDGHHRLVAIWRSGRRTLSPQEYLLVEKDKWKPRTGKIQSLLY